MKLVIFGCGSIAHRIAKGAKLVDNVDLVGFASRDIERAKQYALTYECKEYGNYDYFLNSDVDAVYIATYNLNHYELITECLNHHKHVICEKPMVTTVKENEELFALAKKNNCLLMEAYKAVFLPLTNKIKQLINDNVIGEVHYAEATFIRNGYHGKDHWINDLKTGGCSRDLGCYTIGTLNYLFDIKPTLVLKNTNANDVSDSFSEFNLDYDGVSAHVVMSNDTDGESALTICGSNGYIRVENYWKVGNGYYVVNNQRYEINEEMINDFYYEIKHFADLVDNKIIESPIMNKQDSENKLIITQ